MAAKAAPDAAVRQSLPETVRCLPVACPRLVLLHVEGQGLYMLGQLQATMPRTRLRYVHLGQVLHANDAATAALWADSPQLLPPLACS